MASQFRRIGAAGSDHLVAAFFASVARFFCRRGFGFIGGAFQVEGEKFSEDLFVAEIGGPAVGGGNGGVEFLVRKVKPGGALVVEVRERALLELRGAVGVARFKAGIADKTDLIFDRMNRKNRMDRALL